MSFAYLLHRPSTLPCVMSDGGTTLPRTEGARLAQDALLGPKLNLIVSDGTSIAALCAGGPTLHFGGAHKGESLVEAVRDLRATAEATQLADFGLHSTLFDADLQADAIPTVTDTGVHTQAIHLEIDPYGGTGDRPATSTP
jgi:hypothetical protein